VVKRRLAVFVLVCSAAFGGSAAAPATDYTSSAPAATAKTCSSRYVHAVLPWGHKCLAVGQFCKHDGDRYYHRYRFHCHVRDSRGNYHLTR
jgi:hypothetical protein